MSGMFFQGRYKSILVDKDAYLLELLRYIALNPVRAGMVESPDAYLWSSYRSSAGLDVSPQWLASQFLINHFGSEQAYARFVADGLNASSPWGELQGQIWLGSERFREQMQQKIPQSGVADIPKAQLQPNRPGADDILRIVAEYFGCDVEALLSRSHREAFMLGVFLLRRLVNLPLKDVAVLFGISTSRVSQIQKGILNGRLEHEVNELLKKYKLKN